MVNATTLAIAVDTQFNPWPRHLGNKNRFWNDRYRIDALFGPIIPEKMSTPFRILHLDSSARIEADSRRLSRQVVDRLQREFPTATTTYRDVAQGFPLVDDAMANVVVPAASDPNLAAHSSLQLSNQLADELLQTDIIVLGLPIYNWSIPASFKSYVDQIVRPGKTFAYVDGKRIGLLNATDIYICFTTGGTPQGSAGDFASPYLTFLWTTLGVKNIHWVHAVGMLFGDQSGYEAALASVDGLTLPKAIQAAQTT